MEIRRYERSGSSPLFKFPISNFKFLVFSVADPTFGRLIAFAGVDLEFLLLAFLVDDGERAAIGRDQLHFKLVEFAVLGAIARRVRETVLVAEKCGDAAKNVRNF